MTVGTSRSSNPRLKTGFTLVELLVTITIGVILMTVVAPSFAEIIRNNRVTAHSNELLAAALYARGEAVRRKQNIHVIVDEPAGNGWEAAICISSLCDNPDDPVRYLDYGGTPIAVFLSSNSLPLTITFDPMGRSTLDPAGNTLVLEHDNCTGTQRRRFVFSATGRVEIAPPEACGT